MLQRAYWAVNCKPYFYADIDRIGHPFADSSDSPTSYIPLIGFVVRKKSLFKWSTFGFNTAFGAKCWWHNGAHNKNQKTSKTWNTVRYSVSNNRNPAQSLQENAVTVFGPRLYNSLPKYLRDIESVKTEKFKFELDTFLELIPDQPKMPNYLTASGSNSILDQLTHLRAQGIYQSGWAPDSAMEQS